MLRIMMLEICCRYNGIIKINGGFLGETGKKNAFFPMSYPGEFILEYFPLESFSSGIILPMTKKICLGEETKIFEDDGSIKIYYYEKRIVVEIEPRTVAMCPPNIRMKVLASLNVQYMRENINISVISEAEDYIAFSDMQLKIKGIIKLPFKVKDAKISIKRISENLLIFVEGNAEKSFVCAAEIKELLHLGTFENAKADINNSRIISSIKNSSAKLITEFFEASGEISNKEYILCEKEDETGVIMKLLSAIRQNNRSEAERYLSPALLAEVGYEGIAEFIGEPMITREAFERMKGQDGYNFIYQKSSNVFNVAAFEVDFISDMSGNMLIDNISEL